MKEINFQPEMLVGGLLILWGLSILIKLVWGIDIPIWRPFFGLFLLYWGFCFIFRQDTIRTYKRNIYTYTIHDKNEEVR